MPVCLPIGLVPDDRLGDGVADDRTEIGRKSAAGFQTAELLFHQGQRFFRVDVAEDRHDHVVRHEILGVVVPQVLGRELLDSLRLPP